MHAAKRLIFDIHFKYLWHFRSPTLHQAGHPVVRRAFASPPEHSCVARHALGAHSPQFDALRDQSICQPNRISGQVSPHRQQRIASIIIC